MTNSMGRSMQYVEIESDGLDERWEGLHPPKLETMQDFLDAVRASGLVGLGGAGFPTVVKLTVKNLDQIQCVIINCAECEPYVTSDTRAMLDYDFDVIGGCRLLQSFCTCRRSSSASRKTSPSASGTIRRSWRRRRTWRSVRCPRSTRRAARRSSSTM